MIGVVVDSTADLPPELVERWGLVVVPCLVHFGQTTFREGVDLPRAEFYRRLEGATKPPTTSAPGPGVFAEVYRRLAPECDQIVSVHLSSRLSAVYNSALLGAREVTGVEIAVVDGGSVTMGLGWQAVLAARWAREGRSLEEIVAGLEATRSRVRVFALLDTLEYLRRSGRLNRVVAVLGDLLNVKPVLSVEGGDVHAVGRARSRRKGVALLESQVERLGPLEELAVLHTRASHAAQALMDRLSGLFPRERMVVAEVGTIIGTHVGPNGLGVACLTAL